MSRGLRHARGGYSPAQSKKFRGVAGTNTDAIIIPLPKHPSTSPITVKVFGWLSKYGEKCRMKKSFATSPAPSLIIHWTATAPNMLPSADTPTDVNNAWLHKTEVIVASVVSKNCRTWKERYLQVASSQNLPSLPTPKRYK